MPTILVTGGAGYIGSHVCYELLDSGYDIVVVDSLENSSLDSITALEKRFERRIPTYVGRLQDDLLMKKIFENHRIVGVIHMAGYKSVKASVQDPESYYDNNLLSTLSLLRWMDRYNCTNLIFSSSATVYGDANGECYENSPTSTLNPYGETKLMIEWLLDYGVRHAPMPKTDLHRDAMLRLGDEVLKHRNRFTLGDVSTREDWSFISLRYFNPIGAHPSHIIGENPRGVPENLVPYVMKVLSGDLQKLTVFGDDYDTPDGTAIRDYIHVVDLARAHIDALNYQLSNSANISGKHIRFNIGTGTGYSVLDVIRVFEQIIISDESGATLNWEIGPRRPGDAAKIYANSDRAREVLGWSPKYDLRDMCEDAWAWWKQKSGK